MAGFPPVDQLYYRFPSLRLAGFIAWAVASSKTDEINLVPGESQLNQTQVRPFNSLSSAMRVLTVEHNPGRHYYRGQTSRYQTAYSGYIEDLAEAVPHADPVTMRFESLLPSLFRSVTKDHPPDWDTYDYPPLLDQVAPTIRAIIGAGHEALQALLAQVLHDFVGRPDFLMRRALARMQFARIELPDEDTVEGLALPTSLMHLVSISQHYGYGSIMTDVTSSPEVAAWFSSHEVGASSSSICKRDGEGVVYRLDYDRVRAALEKEIRTETRAALAIEAAGVCGVADIRKIDMRLGLRPAHQLGGSILGLENSIVYHIMDVYDCIDVFTFPHATTMGTELDVRHEHLFPKDDDTTRVFHPDNWDAGPLADTDVVGFMERMNFAREEIDRFNRARAEQLL